VAAEVAHRHGVPVDVGTSEASGCAVRGSADRLTQALGLLMHRAARAARRGGGGVEVRVGSHAERGWVDVLHGGPEPSAGPDLEWSLARWIVEHGGGAIEVEVVGASTRYRVCLPRA
jgi:hypothetical protein